MSDKYVLAIDQGTTGSTVLIVRTNPDQSSQIVSKATVDFEQHYPKPSWVEHDLHQIWSSVEAAANKAVDLAKTDKAFTKDKIVAIGITNQRETLCVFDAVSSQPDCNAIVWQCKRSTDICETLKKNGFEKTIKEKTGLVLDPYFSGTKITWLMENKPEIRERLESGKAILGTIDTFLIHKLTGGKVHATEASNASRTLLYNIHKGEWDLELLDILKVTNHACLPCVKDSSGDFGSTLNLSFLPDGIPITGVLGDQQAALAGQTCFSVGEAKCTYGTGAFLLLNTGEIAETSANGLLTTIAWQLDGKVTYALEGSSFIAGAAIQFLRDQLQILENSCDSESLSKNEAAAPHLYFVPTLSGLGAPYWEPNVQGALLGLTRGTTKGQIIRAAIEGISFQVYDLVKAMAADSSEDLKILRVDGGACANDLLMQIQSNYLNVEVERPRDVETTALGAAMFAALGVGIFRSLDELKGARKIEKVFVPSTVSTDTHLKGWKRAIEAVRVFAQK